MGKIRISTQECIKKFSPSEKREIFKAFDKLKDMITLEEQYGRPFEKVFNNEALKYDILGNGFYTFKAHGRDHCQIRILYKFNRMLSQDFEVEIHMVSIKRRDDKSYMRDFQRYVECYV
ncbi:MAG: hypothetical protein IKJ01_02820 [Lachnospiraceae bacterium]|nr:hypothetical protein [Lachnospiraceae bacterium]